ncbi:hypothetical protein llap_3659 [Limosa lapponica baueri]|uniref:Uncharacterized protein n=1 Tax=Limosa lapponica baueri TaxID=1758121 RepID=A0A2I0UJ13_LIMLA|nr:hypothetical protein llap_3659 [Limosa lapponica baueri]
MEEYNDAAQRAARLSAARESFLTGKKNPVNAVTQEGLMIYTRWLMCQLHSLEGICHFHQVLQRLPISHRINVADEKSPDVVQDNWVKLRNAFDKNSDIFNIDVFPCTRVLRRNAQDHSAQFMEFAEVENHDDFYTSEEGYIHAQDQRGVYIIYDVAVEDLKELKNQLLLVASQYIEKGKSKLFAKVLIEDPVLVQEIALSLLEVGTEKEKKIGREKQLFILDFFSTLLELATLCHRLIEVATESARLARPPEAFISIQLEKQGPRDRMLDTFSQRREALGSSYKALSFHPRPCSLLSPDGHTFLRLWFIPHPTEGLIMFKILPEKPCLCSLSGADRRVAHGETVAMQFLVEDVLQNSYGSAVEDHVDCQASLAKSKQCRYPVPAVKAIVRQMGTEEEFGEAITSTQHMLPPRGASEIKMKVYQISGNRATQENFSVVQPQIVETFVQRVTENYQESDTEGKLDVYRLSIEQRVFEIISEVRREGVDNMIDLKKKFGSTENNGDLKEHLFKEALQNEKECLNAKMMAEQEVTSFQGQPVRKALATSQADNDKLKKQLHKQIVMKVFTNIRLRSTTLGGTGGRDLICMACHTIVFKCGTDSKM